MSNANKKLELPSVLSFERKLEVSDGLMYSGNWNNIEQSESWQPITITKRQNRSTQSAYGIEDDKKSQPNPVASDSDDANLPMDKDTLRLSFTLRVIGNLGKPFACNSPDFEKVLIGKVSDFKEVDGRGLETLALRYAHNIANGRFLWRNRVCAEQINIMVYLNGGEKPLTFNARDYSLSDFSINISDVNLESLKGHILAGLNGDENNFVFLRIEAYAKLGNGQHVFPSQEMNMNAKGKELFRLDNCVAIHNVKIGNAIRTIDNWYPNAKFPIAVEPYGSVTQIGQAFREKAKDGDLYSLILSWLNGDDIGEQANYVVANLIRGGLFQGKGKDDKKGKTKNVSGDGK